MTEGNGNGEDQGSGLPPEPQEGDEVGGKRVDKKIDDLVGKGAERLEVPPEVKDRLFKAIQDLEALERKRAQRQSKKPEKPDGKGKIIPIKPPTPPETPGK